MDFIDLKAHQVFEIRLFKVKNILDHGKLTSWDTD